MKKSEKYSPEIMERAVRLVSEAKEHHPSEWAAIVSIAANLGCSAETLRRWVRRHQRDTGQREGLPTAERDRLKALEREVRELRKANEISAVGQRVFRPGGARPPFQVMWAFIDQYRETLGVEPIFRVLQIAPSGYRRHAARQRDLARRSARAQRDEVLMRHIRGAVFVNRALAKVTKYR